MPVNRFRYLIRFLKFSYIILTSCVSMQGQSIIEIMNPSFEDIPRQGGELRLDIKGWFDCGQIRFPDESPPDVHPGNYWRVNIPPSDGMTYLGLVVRDNDTYEGLSQRLGKMIEAGKCYTFSIDLTKSNEYVSQSRLTSIVTNYVQPTVLRVWGGISLCNDKELLAESMPINHSDWRTYEFKIKSRSSHQFLMVEAYYKTPVFLPYCGHLLLDNLSNIVEVPCDETQKEIAEVIPTKPKNKPLPPHKQGRVDDAVKEPEVVVNNKPAPKKKILSELDINKIKKGTKVEIKNLYFKADSSDITEKSFDVLDEVSNFLIDNPKVSVEIGGHTNGIPDHTFCDDLSSRRAKAVYEYLINKGVDKSKLSYKGYGKRRRIASDQTAEGRRKNQRVEITILSLG